MSRRCWCGVSGVALQGPAARGIERSKARSVSPVSGEDADVDGAVMATVTVAAIQAERSSAHLRRASSGRDESLLARRSEGEHPPSGRRPQRASAPSRSMRSWRLR